MGVITERYPATVSSVDDPENRGRIKVSCAGLLGDEDSVLPEFVEPVFDWGWFVVPDVGEIVEIEAVVGSDEDESYQQMSLDNPDLKWRGKRFITDPIIAGENTASAVNAAFTEKNYGKRRGFATPAGHVFLFDDTEGDTRIFLTWVKERITVAQALLGQKPVINQILLDSDGIKWSVEDKQFIHLKPSNELEISLNGGATLLLKDAGDLVTAVLGVGDVSVAIGETLQTLWTAFKVKMDLFDSHIHPTGVGPSGTPVPIVDMPAYDTAINSDRLKIADN